MEFLLQCIDYKCFISFLFFLIKRKFIYPIENDTNLNSDVSKNKKYHNEVLDFI